MLNIFPSKRWLPHNVEGVHGHISFDSSECRNAMQCLLPHEASTTCPVGTEPWVSIQLRGRRPKAVDRLAISSQPPFIVVGENSPMRTKGVDSLAAIVSSRWDH